MKKVLLVASLIYFFPVWAVPPTTNSSSNVKCVAGGAVVSSTSVSFGAPIHGMTLSAGHFTKILPGGMPANIHNQTSSRSNTSGHFQSHTEPTESGGTSNEFNVDAEHIYLYCSPAIEDFSKFSNAKKECSSS